MIRPSRILPLEKSRFQIGLSYSPPSRKDRRALIFFICRSPVVAQAESEKPNQLCVLGDSSAAGGESI